MPQAPVRVLVVDDEEDFATALVTRLARRGFEARATFSGAAALAELRHGEKLAFAALLVTDINTQNSLMLVKGDPEVIRRISYAHVEQDEVFDLPGVVSRKKQLIPYFTSLLKEMANEGVTPTARGQTQPPQALP